MRGVIHNSSWQIPGTESAYASGNARNREDKA
jgi:hypothetical protein